MGIMIDWGQGKERELRAMMTLHYTATLTCIMVCWDCKKQAMNYIQMQKIPKFVRDSSPNNNSRISLVNLAVWRKPRSTTVLSRYTILLHPWKSIEMKVAAEKFLQMRNIYKRTYTNTTFC